MKQSAAIKKLSSRIKSTVEKLKVMRQELKELKAQEGSKKEIKVKVKSVVKKKTAKKYK